MKQEQDHQPQELPLEEVTRMAKEAILRVGYHLPTVIADSGGQAAIIQLEHLADTYEERTRQLFTTGFLLAESRQVRTLKQVFFVTEAWMSTAQGGEPPHLLPSQDPQRKEILVISVLKMTSQRSRMVIFEMLRDETGALTELKAFEQPADEDTEVDSPLLRAFVAGFSAGRGKATN